jgi:hypothetical protein
MPGMLDMAESPGAGTVPVPVEPGCPASADWPPPGLMAVDDPATAAGCDGLEQAASVSPAASARAPMSVLRCG